MRDWHPYMQLFALFLILFATFIAVTGLVLLNDIRVFQEKFETKEKMFLLDIDGKLSTGFVFTKIEGQELRQLQAHDFDVANELYKQKGHNFLKGNVSLLFIVKDSAFTVNELYFNETGRALSRTTVLNVIKSGTPLQLFASVSDVQVETLKNSFSDEELRVYLFSRLMIEEINKRGVNFLVEETQKGGVIIEPKSFMLKLLPIIPLNIIKPLTPDQDIPKIRVVQ